MSDMGVFASAGRGAALLDVKSPGWHRRIDPGSLDLSDPCDCVLGQLGGYSPELERLVRDVLGVDLRKSDVDAWAYRHGFDSPTPEGCLDLDFAWFDEISRRAVRDGVGNLLIDWTARQYDPPESLPLISACEEPALPAKEA